MENYIHGKFSIINCERIHIVSAHRKWSRMRGYIKEKKGDTGFSQRAADKINFSPKTLRSILSKNKDRLGGIKIKTKQFYIKRSTTSLKKKLIKTK